jgi:tetratricopeptide (TPR) repeat protein
MAKNRVLPFPTPKVTGDSWQIGYVRYPGWVEEGDERYRPSLALAVSGKTGLIGSSDLVAPQDLGIELMRAAMDSLAEVSGARPAIVEVNDFELAADLRILLENEGIVVECRDDLPLLNEPLREMSRELTEKEPYQAANEIPGVEIGQLRAFAEAADIFRRAAPWTQLDSSDIIEVAAPRPAPTVRFACVLGAEGEYGLGFAGERFVLELGDDDEERGFDRLADNTLWSVTFHEPWEVPIAEHDAWLDHGLATDPEGRIPSAVQFGPKRRVRRASPRMLAFFEGVFRALAETTEDELDRGEWSKVVETSGGTLELSLSLPDVLTPPAPSDDAIPLISPLRSAQAMDAVHDLLAGQDFESEDEMKAFLDSELVGRELPPPRVEGPQAEAVELALQAMETPGRRGVALARRALALDPDSPHAHLAVAEKARDPESAVERFRGAMAVAERALDPEIFREGVGKFWAITETRPYMEARLGLADNLWFTGHRQEAVEHYSELLRLNPHDNQGVRSRVVPAMLLMGEDEAAREVLESYEDDAFASTLFNHALVAFRRHGDGEEARARLEDALEANDYVADLLLDRDEPELELTGAYTLGSPEEAAYYLLEAHEAWEKTPGALEWLEEVDQGL